MKILNVVGARPNFMKIAPLIKQMRQYPDIVPVLVHTGQHYDATMAGQFFEELQIPEPDIALGVGGGSHAYQTAEVMKRLEPVLEQTQPHLVVVVGDVNSTLAAALTAAKLQIPVAHVEAGLRSFDRSMPEEINRLVTDSISDYLFVTEQSGRDNLLREGVSEDKIHFVGNVMIDSLEAFRRQWQDSDIRDRLGLQKGTYGVVTLHRPSNVDAPTTLRGLMAALAEVAQTLPLIFPVHPRTRKQLETMTDVVQPNWRWDTPSPAQGVYCFEPFGYTDFMALVAGARLALTDSGGLQEETTVLGVPCLTLRENTERPVTISHGTNTLVGVSPEKIVKEAARVLDAPQSVSSPPPLWDGAAAQRIVSILRAQANEDRVR